MEFTVSIPEVKATLLGRAPEKTVPAKPVLLVGPSIGTDSSIVWEAAAAILAEDFTVLAWDLPGHGASPAATEGFTMAELAQGVLAVVDALQAENEGECLPPVYFAGDSLGGAVGLQLAVDHPERFNGFGILCSGAKIGEEQAWHDRAETVRRQGTPVLIAQSAERWFAPGFIEKAPEVSGRLLNSLQHADKESYAFCCEALATFDVRDRLGGIQAPVIAIAGAHDVVTPLPFAQEVADGVAHGRALEIAEAGHLAPAETPAVVARELKEFFLAAVAEEAAEAEEKIESEAK